MLPNLLRRQLLPEQEHELGHSTLRGAVEAAQHTALQQFAPHLVAVHLDAATGALRDVNHDYAALRGLAKLLEEPLVSRSIAAAEGLQHNAAQAGTTASVMPGKSLRITTFLSHA